MKPLLAMLIAALMLAAPCDARADCKSNGRVCSTNMSCCSRNCAKPIAKKATALFGLCCPSGARLVGGTCCVPNCTNRNCGGDGCGGSCGSCAMSDCDTTTGMCVACIPDGDQGCRGNFDCCSGVCGAGTVCETTTTTTTTTTSTTTTTLCGLTLTNSVLTTSVNDEVGTTTSGNLIVDSGAVDPDGDVVFLGSVSFDAATSSNGLTAVSTVIAGQEIVDVYAGAVQDAAHLLGALDVNLSTGAYVYTNGAGAEAVPVGNTTAEFRFSVNDGTPDCTANGSLNVVVAGDDESTEMTTTTTTTTTTTLPSCGPQGVLIACTCGDGRTPCTSAATVDCTGPTPDCAAHRAECVSFCGTLGPGTCDTATCIDCGTNLPCQGSSPG